jgi:hypothetical protein
LAGKGRAPQSSWARHETLSGSHSGACKPCCRAEDGTLIVNGLAVLWRASVGPAKSDLAGPAYERDAVLWKSAAMMH